MLDEVELQQLWHRHCEREGRQRQINAAQPQRRQAEQKSESKADQSGDGQRQRIVHVGMFDQDRRGIGAERVERALAQRKLSAAAGQDIERQHRDGVDQHGGELKDEEVLDEERNQQQQNQYPQRGAEAERHGLFGNGVDRRRFGGGFLNSAHDQTRLTMGRPSRPAGLTTSTVIISASAIGSFSSLPT